jgi:Arm DNA-binding domain
MPARPVVSASASLPRRRAAFGGKQKTLALGVYPTVTLKLAREKRDEAKRLLADGIDPSIQRRLEKLSAQTGNGFRAVAEELLLKLEKENRAETTLTKMRWVACVRLSGGRRSADCRDNSTRTAFGGP